MKDLAVPSIFLQNEGVPIVITIPSTQATIRDQGYTYNQAGLTYNQAGVMYAGVQNQDQNTIPILDTAYLEKPSLSIQTESNISLTASRTNALLNDQGYAYNQAGLTYNQLGVAYGGVQNYNEDIVPMSLSFIDIYNVKQTPSGNSGMLIGILGLTYP